MKRWRAAIALCAAMLVTCGCANDGERHHSGRGAPGRLLTVDAAVAASGAATATAATSSTAAAVGSATATASVATSASTDAGAAQPACPPEMAHIGDYCIDRYEAHLIEIGPAGEEIIHPFNARPTRGVRYQARSKAGAWPQGYVSRDESLAACEAASKRLCSWLEWRRGCQGKRWFRYPYGNGGKRGACNNRKDHLMAKLFGDDPMKWTQEAFNSPLLNEEPGYLAKTGAYAECRSADGLYDMVGNLHEWVSGMVTKRFMERMAKEKVRRRKQPWKVGNAMFLGGFFSTLSEHGPGCHFVTVAHAARYHDYSTGFRCCADAKQAQSGVQK